MSDACAARRSHKKRLRLALNAVLDHAKFKAFACESCDRPSQILRNCDGRGKDALNLLNGAVYKRCPKGLWLAARAERELVHLYIECREMKVWPDQGTMMDQTAFTVELFGFLDPLMSEWRHKKQVDHEAAMKAAAAKHKATK